MRTTLAVAGFAAAVSAHTYTVTETVSETLTSCGPEVTDCPGANQWGEWDPASTTTTPDDESTTWGTWMASTPAESTTTPCESTTASWNAWTSSGPGPSTADPSWKAWTSSGPAPSSTTEASWNGWTSTGPAGSTTDPWQAWTASTPAVTSSASWNAWTSSAACPPYTATGPPAWFSQLPPNVLSSMESKWTAGPPADWCYYTYSTATMPPTPVGPTSTPVADTSTWAQWTASSSGPAIPKYTGAANANGVSLAIAGLAAAAAVALV